ncbi:DUF5810 domain-containing protein [Natrinema salsiterrestre]|uniref:DUF5810 domain-containing protein n=1 Tax=Natrinema salsiterrestre TaxID=2950540 RepID=A0A9Q4L1X3_9EURY|nr:DUF5810 domain-containing protein [Natrinema salsiterrestre]MDF9745017.1 DUF5810 domain-containing protein [Natrinema salsiterrestre]
MGYACPVCDVEEADAVHLANHLAITASLGREEHREWLAEYAPDWGDRSPEELGEIVAPHAEEIDTPDFEDSGHGHERGRPGSLEEGIARQSSQPGRGAMTAEAEDVLREAAELTREMQSSSESDGDGDDDPVSSPDDADGDVDGNGNA